MPGNTAETLIAAAKRVLIAEDHPLYRDALRAVIPQACPKAEIAEACTQAEVLEQVVSDSAFDLIVLDLNLPGAVGYSCLKQARQIAKLTPIIVVSALDDAAIMGKAVLAGATAYVPKSASRQVLLDDCPRRLVATERGPCEHLRPISLIGRDPTVVVGVPMVEIPYPDQATIREDPHSMQVHREFVHTTEEGECARRSCRG